MPPSWCAASSAATTTSARTSDSSSIDRDVAPAHVSGAHRTSCANRHGIVSARRRLSRSKYDCAWWFAIHYDSRRCIAFLCGSDELQRSDKKPLSETIAMKKISIAFLAAVSLATFGCKKKGGADVVAKMNEFKDRMCACKDKAC